MKDATGAALGGMWLGFLLGLVTTFWIGALIESVGWERKAIERGYALYCPTTGRFAWKGECDD